MLSAEPAMLKPSGSAEPEKVILLSLITLLFVLSLKYPVTSVTILLKSIDAAVFYVKVFTSSCAVTANVMLVRTTGAMVILMV